MAGYKGPTLAERQEAARKARTEALGKLKAKPPLSEDELKLRKEAADRRDQAAAEKRAAKVASRQEAAAAKQLAKSPPPGPSEAERKAERDRRYAARKARK